MTNTTETTTIRQATGDYFFWRTCPVCGDATLHPTRSAAESSLAAHIIESHPVVTLDLSNPPPSSDNA